MEAVFEAEMYDAVWMRWHTHRYGGNTPSLFVYAVPVSTRLVLNEIMDRVEIAAGVRGILQQPDSLYHSSVHCLDEVHESGYYVFVLPPIFVICSLEPMEDLNLDPFHLDVRSCVADTMQLKSSWCDPEKKDEFKNLRSFIADIAATITIDRLERAVNCVDSLTFKTVTNHVLKNAPNDVKLFLMGLVSWYNHFLDTHNFNYAKWEDACYWNQKVSKYVPDFLETFSAPVLPSLSASFKEAWELLNKLFKVRGIFHSTLFFTVVWRLFYLHLASEYGCQTKPGNWKDVPDITDDRRMLRPLVAFEFLSGNSPLSCPLPGRDITMPLTRNSITDLLTMQFPACINNCEKSVTIPSAQRLTCRFDCECGNPPGKLRFCSVDCYNVHLVTVHQEHQS